MPFRVASWGDVKYFDDLDMTFYPIFYSEKRWIAFSEVFNTQEEAEALMHRVAPSWGNTRLTVIPWEGSR